MGAHTLPDAIAMMRYQVKQPQALMKLLLVLIVGVSSCLAFQGPQFSTRGARNSQATSCTGRPTTLVLRSSAEDPSSNGEEGDASPAEDAPSSYVRCGRCEAVYAVSEQDLGKKGRRLECSVCGHSWYQSKDRIMGLKSGFQMVPLPESDRNRIAMNIEQGREPKFMGDVKLYVGNVAFECHEDDIMEIFSRVGEVGEVSLVRDDTGKNRGFGFVTMRTKEDGDKAIEALDGVSVRGRNIAVRASNT